MYQLRCETAAASGVRKDLPVMLSSEATVQRSGAWATDLGLYATLY